MSPQATRRLFVAVLFAIVAAVATLPVAALLTTHISGSGGDPWQVAWRFEHRWDELTTATAEGHLGNYLRQEFLGGGEARLVNLSVWPWMPLHILFGQPLAYNLVWLLSFAGSGLAMYWLVSLLLKLHFSRHGDSQPPHGHTTAAVLAGMAYMLSAYHFAHTAGHFGAMQLQWLPLLYAVTITYFHRPRFWWGVLLVILVVIQGWTEHHYLFWFFLSLPVLIGFYWSQATQLWQRPAERLAATVTAASAVGLVWLAYWPTVRLSATAETLQLGLEQTIRFSADLLAYVIPPSFHSIWGSPAHTVFGQSFTGNLAEATHFIPYTVLLLIAFFHQRIPKQQKWLWFWIAFIFLVISLGPRLHLFGHVLPLPLPWAILDSLPVFDAIRTVARASVMVILAISVLFGWVVATAVHRCRIFAFIFALLAIETLALPIPVMSFAINDVYYQFRDKPGEAIIEVPAATNYAFASRALYASNVHGKEVAGSIALERAVGANANMQYKSLPGLRQVLYLSTGQLRSNTPDFLHQQLAESLLDSAAVIGANHVIIHIDSVSPLQYATLERFFEKSLGLVPEQHDDIVTFDLERSPVVRDNIVISRDSRWQVFYQEQLEQMNASFTHEASLTAYNTTLEEQAIQLELRLHPDTSTPFTVMQDGAPVWQYEGQALRSYIVPLQLAPRASSDINFFAPEGQPIRFDDVKLEVL